VGKSLAKIKRPFGVVLIAVANLVIYISVAAYALNNYLSPHTSFYDGAAAFMTLEFYTGLIVTYSIVGIIGVFGLLVRWRSFRELAMIGWAFECVIFSIISIFYYYQVILIAVVIVLFKIISIVYFARKKT
jgi:hypothetical protein